MCTGPRLGTACMYVERGLEHNLWKQANLTTHQLGFRFFTVKWDACGTDVLTMVAITLLQSNPL